MKKLLIVALLAWANVVQAAEAKQLKIGQSVTLQSGDIILNISTLEHAKNPLTSKRLLGCYQPLLLEIKNTGTADYLLTEDGYSLPLTPLKCVAKKYKTTFSALFPLVGLGAGAVVGLLLRSPIPGVQFGYQASAAVGAAAFNMLIPLITAGVGLTVGLVVGGAGAIRSSKVNKKKRKVLAKHAIDLRKPLEIKAGTTVQKIMYIRKKKFTPQFTLTLEKMGEAKTIELNASL